MCDMRRFFERLKKANIKLAPCKALLGVAEIILLGHKISAGVGPGPAEVSWDRCLELNRTIDGTSP